MDDPETYEWRAGQPAHQTIKPPGEKTAPDTLRPEKRAARWAEP